MHSASLACGDLGLRLALAVVVCSLAQEAKNILSLCTRGGAQQHISQGPQDSSFDLGDSSCACCTAVPQEYAPMGGDPTFCALSRKLAFGEDCPAIAAGRVATVQSLSGTGALRVGAEFLKRHHAVHIVYLPDPTW